MENSTIAILILGIAVVLFVSEKIPLSVSALLAMLAMAFTGVISYEEAFSGFSNRVVFMIIGMSMVSTAFFSVGLSHKVARVLMRFTVFSEKVFVFALFLFALFLGAFFNAMIVITMLAPVIDSVAEESGGKLTRRMAYMPMAIGGVMGGHATSISASCIISASGLLENSYYGRGMRIFEPLKAGLPGIVVSILFFLTIGYSLQKKCFDFPKTDVEVCREPSSKTAGNKTTWRMWFVLAVTTGCMLCFMAGLNMGAVALFGACLVIASGCVTAREAIGGVSWETVITVAASLGFARGIEVSGAGQIITDMVLRLCGPISSSAYGMCLIMLFLGTLLSNFMSNTAAVTILAPIGIALARTLGADAMAFALACGIGTDMAIATPICTAAITYTLTAGYRVKDYLRVGGLLNLLVFIADAAALGFWYFI